MSSGEEPIVVTLCGGGNGAHVAVGVFGSQKGRCVVNVLTRRPKDWSDVVYVSTPEGITLAGGIKRVTSNPAEVIPHSHIVLLCAPVNAYIPILKSIAPYLKSTTFVGSLFGQGGLDMMVRHYCGAQITTFAFQFIPWISRIQQYGRTASLLGRKKFLNLGVTPRSRAKEVSRVIERLFGQKVKVLSSSLALTLTPSNQIIHPSRYYGIFKNWVTS